MQHRKALWQIIDKKVGASLALEGSVLAEFARDPRVVVGEQEVICLAFLGWGKRR